MQSTFERVRAKRESRAPSQSPPRRVSSPTLLTGLLKCGVCGHAMTLVTGKSGKYRYYKCASRHNQGNHACTSGNLPMEKLDELVLAQLADKSLCTGTPASDDDGITQAHQVVQGWSAGTHQRDSTGRSRRSRNGSSGYWMPSRQAPLNWTKPHNAAPSSYKAAREALFIELAGVRRDTSLPAVEYLKASQVDVFGKVLRQKLLANGSPLAKSYLNILVDEIVVEEKTATIKGSYAALAETMQKIKLGNLNQVPSFIPDWCARSDSNA